MLAAANARAAAPDRIHGAIDASRTRPVAGTLHPLAQLKYDAGEADPRTPMNYMVMLFQPSAAQRADLDRFTAQLQDPTSPLYRHWLTPEAFRERFGMSDGDLAKISAWLTSQGFAIAHRARGGNWIAFNGTAAQTASAFHTSIRRYIVDGETHYANASDPQVPEALAGIAAGFLGLNDFHAQPAARLVPDYNFGAQHYIAPADFATIYDLAPLQQAGLDGSGQSIAIVGESHVQASDLSAFRALYGLPPNAPKLLLYNGQDPGYNGAETEGALDLEWAGAIAPQATLYYIYGASALTAMVFAIEEDIAPVISVSYSGCEVSFPQPVYEALGQQASAQGITIVASSGDSGGAGCDQQGFMPMATLGRGVNFPAVLPEVTGVGGTEFLEGTGTYWGVTNSALLGSALSYIPEAVWNETGGTGLLASGGGASRYYAKPAWQTGMGVPNDGARDVPDISFSAALHDGYQIVIGGSNAAVGGTSCGTPTMAGIVALLNQYQMQNGKQSAAGLGNINPQLYRLAQSAPSAFHDVTAGDNLVACAQGTADCATGSFGYMSGPGYDPASGLGSLDVNALFTQWNSAAAPVAVTLSANVAGATINDTVRLTAIVAPVNGSGQPTGSVNFTSVGGNPLGSVPLSMNNGNASASIDVAVEQLGGTGTFNLVAQYSGDAVFSGAGALLKFLVSKPIGAAAVVATGPNTVSPLVDLDTQGLSWTAQLQLHEFAGVPALLTGFSIDGVAQSVPQYFPSPALQANGALTANVTLRNVNPPAVHTFSFTGVDAAGASWSRQVAVNYYPPAPQNQYSFTATPLTVTQTSNPSCQFPVQVNLNDSGGFANVFSTLYAGTHELANQLSPVFGTTRLQAWSSLQGTICVNGVTPPGSDYVYAVRGDNFVQQVQVNFAAAPANPAVIAVSQASVTLKAAAVSEIAQATLSVSISDKSQPWTAAIYPANRTSGWLSASRLSGTGTGQITLTASGYGFEPGAYHAWIVIQCANAQPQTVTVPIMFILGPANSGISISSVINPASGQPTAAPGMVLSVFGANLAAAAQTTAATSGVLPFSAASAGATVNGLAAPILYVSPTQINIQIPYEVGAGPAVLGVTNNGQVAGYMFTVAPSAPAIYTDGNGNLLSNPSASPGGLVTLLSERRGRHCSRARDWQPCARGRPDRASAPNFGHRCRPTGHRKIRGHGAQHSGYRDGRLLRSTRRTGRFAAGGSDSRRGKQPARERDGEATLPVTREIALRYRCPGKNSAGGTSRWAHAGYRPEGRSPSLRLECQDIAGRHSRSESSRPIVYTPSLCRTHLSSPPPPRE